MKRLLYIGFLTLTAFLLTGCGQAISQVSKGEFYPKVYAHQPKSILVLPARNTTTSVDATDHFRYTITKPLAEQGYYVFPVHLVDAFFKSENITDPEMVRQISVKKLKEIFDADAILYVDINTWDTGYTVFSSNVDVGLSFSLVDTKTGEEIWQNNAYAYSYQGLDGNNGLAGLIVSAIVTAVNTGTDYTALAYTANNVGSKQLPQGVYGRAYQKDVDEKIAILDSARLEEGRLYVDEYFISGLKKEEKVPLTVRQYQKGYFAFPVNNLNFFKHNGYSNYYVTQEINGKKFLRNRFFQYENGYPYLLANGKKVFVFAESDGTIPHSEENGKYYFQIDHVVDLKSQPKS